MSEVLQTNIFFFITSLAVVVVTILVAVILYRVIKILKRLEDIADRVRAGTEQLADDVSTARAYVKSGVANVIGLVAGGMRGKSAARKKRNAAARAKPKETAADDIPA